MGTTNAEATTEDAEVRLELYEKQYRISSDYIKVTSFFLGHGSYGGRAAQTWNVSVHMYTRMSIIEVRVALFDGCPIAVKMFYKDTTKKIYQRKLLAQEVSGSSSLKHPNIVKVCGVTRQKEH